MLNSSVKVYPSQWNRKKQQAIVSNQYAELDNRNNKIANDRLRAIRKHYTDTIIEIQDNPDKFSNFINIFAEHLNIRSMANKKTNEQAFTKQLNQINIKDIVEDKTKETREPSFVKWGEFLKQHGIADTPESFNYSNWERFSRWLLEQRKKNGEKFTIGTLNTYQNNLKALVNRWNKEHPNTPINTKVLANTKPHKQLSSEQKQSKYIILTNDELEKVYNTHLEKPQQETAKNLFLIQCLIGCRTSDLKKIIKGAYKTKEVGGLTYINYHSRKTNEQAFTPLINDTAKELFQWLKTLKNEFPFSQDSVYNDNIKQAFKEMGYTQETEYTEMRGTEIVPKHAPMYQIIHPHTGRHIFATLMYYMGVPLEQVKIMTGHKDIEILQAVYTKLDSVKELEKLSERLQATPQPTATGTPTQKITDLKSAKLQIANERLYNENTEYRQQIFELEHENNELKDELETERQTHTPNYDEGDMYVDYILSLTEKG